jgi:hypothetical protein
VLHLDVRTAAGEVDPPECAHRRDHGQQEHGIGFGEPRFHAEKGRCREQQAGQHGGPPRHEGERGPIGEQHRPTRAEERRDAVEPDRGAGLGHAGKFRGFHHRCLQPIDADRFLVAVLILEADIDIVAAFQHLLGGLGEPRLVAIDRGDLEEPGQKGEEGDEEEHRHRTPVRAGGKSYVRA